MVLNGLRSRQNVYAVTLLVVVLLTMLRYTIRDGSGKTSEAISLHLGDSPSIRSSGDDDDRRGNARVHLGAPQVVLSMATYPIVSTYWENPFIWSLRCAGYKGDIVLVVPPELHKSPPRELATFFQNMGVITQAAGGDMEGITCPSLETQGTQTGIDTRCRHAEYSRYYEFQRALSKYHEPNTRVLLVDFRDTIFQADPFSMPELESELMMTAELPYKTIGQGYHTSMWIKECFGKNASKLLSKQLVLCAGSVMGNKQGVDRYLDRMLEPLPSLVIKPECRDQGVYTIGLFCKGNHGEVNSTMIAAADRGYVIENEDGKLTPVVHQIDRCEMPYYDAGTHEAHLLKRCPSIARVLEQARS